MSEQTKAMLKSWFNAFMVAILASLITILAQTHTLALDWDSIMTVLYSGVIAVLPVIKNYFDSGYTGYGKEK